MKKFLLLILVLAVVFVAVEWSNKTEILSSLDGKIANIMMSQQDEPIVRNVFDDLNSGNYRQDEKFLLKKYAEDLGYYVVGFPKYDKGTILILRYGPRKIVVTDEEKIVVTIDGDKWDDGLDIKFRMNVGDYLIDYGERRLASRVNNDRILQIASVLNNLRVSDTLREMADKNRADFEKYISTPEILTGFS